jgi:hypothetical protein
MSLNTASESIISSTKRRLGLIFLLAVLISGCGPKPKIEPITPIALPEIPRPYDLTVNANSGKATLYWSIDRTLNPPISGYRIYLTNNSHPIDTAAWKDNPGIPYNSDPYPGDTDGDITHESYNLDNLENGKFYYAIIRTVGFDNRESALSNVVSFRPLAGGEFTISSNHLGDDGGFNFETGTQVPGKDRRSDLYLYSNGNKTGLSSPSRLSAWLRKTSFSAGGEHNLETIAIKAGDKILLETKYGHIDLTVVSLDGNYPEISAKIRYIFYPESR